MAGTKTWAVGVIILVTFLLTFTHLFLKRGVSLIPALPAEPSALVGFALSFLHNPYLICGFLLYAISGALFILALKGGEISVLAPLFSMNFVWVSFVGMLVFGEAMNIIKWVGVGCIVIGVSLVGIGGRQ